MRLVIFLFLASCGPPASLSFSKVDPAWRADFDALAEGLGGLVSFDERGAYSVTLGPVPDGAAGAALGFNISMLPYDECGQKVGKRMRRAYLAHELGHLFGLEHSRRGIMRYEPTSECVDREAECLLEALNERPSRH